MGSLLLVVSYPPIATILYISFTILTPRSTYSHEHGQSPIQLMNYTPRYDLVAYKNNDEHEPDAGFKSFVLSSGPYLVHLSIHVQTSNIRRMRQRYHTVSLAIVHRATGEVMMDVASKADFGFLGVRAKGSSRLIALTRRDEEILQRQELSRETRKFRSVNVINIGRLDGRYAYREDVLRGRYERWGTLPLCSTSVRFGGVMVDVKTPINGIVSGELLDEAVGLGFPGRRNDGIARTVLVKGLRVGGRFCLSLIHI